MRSLKAASVTVATLCIASFAFNSQLSAQLGRQKGLIEPNVASDSALLSLPSMNAGLVQALKGARPILSVVVLDSILASRTISNPQRTDLYGKMFVHVDLNRGTDAEFMLIPGVDAGKLQTLKGSRPWKTFEQFRTEMTKSTSAAEVERLEQYLFIPIELNTFTPEIIDTFLGIGVGTARWKKEFDEYRPWTSMEQFDREIGKYVRGNPGELKRLARYVTIAPL